MTRLTAEALQDLCDRYVPRASRHPNATPSAELWWPAHEIGHLLVAQPEEIGLPLFGLDISVIGGGPDFKAYEHYVLCVELAAMSISRRLLFEAGERQLVRDERRATDYETLMYDDRGGVQKILIEHQCVKLPRTVEGLERKIQRKLAHAKRTSRLMRTRVSLDPYQVPPDRFQ